VLLVDADPECGRALARVLQRRGHRVRLAGSARAAAAAARETFDLAVVDLLVAGGGVDLARRLSRLVPRLYLSVGARLLPGEIVEAAVGFSVLRKAAVPRLVGGTAGARRRRFGATARAKGPAARRGPRDPAS
jgi:CheY-like chemotaxis protein